MITTQREEVAQMSFVDDETGGSRDRDEKCLIEATTARAENRGIDLPG